MNIIALVSINCREISDGEKFFAGSPEEIRRITLPTLVIMDVLEKRKDTKDYVDRPFKKSYDVFRREFENLIDKLDSLSDSTKLKERVFYKITDSKISLSPYAIVKSLEDTFSKLSQREETREIMEKFITDNFGEAGDDVKDFQESLKTPHPLSETLNDPDLKYIADSIESTWSHLIKVRSPQQNFSFSSLIDLRKPFSVPGGRFRESYYWDNYWVLKGLMCSGMYDTAYNIIQNNIELIKRFGYIPNGTRYYYCERSQPPMFISMCKTYCDHMKFENISNEILTEMFNAMELEYQWWINNRSLSVENSGDAFVCNFYGSDKDYPRLESYREDIDTFEQFLNASLKIENLTVHEKLNILTSREDLLAAETDIYQNIRASAESGWDFSSRFLQDPTKLYTNHTKETIPVDLNTIMYYNECVLAEFAAKIHHNREKATYYEELSRKREKMIRSLLFNDYGWMDWNLKSKSFTRDNFYFSNLFPLFYLNISDSLTRKILTHYKDVLFSVEFGIPASDNKTGGQQWDFPMVWAPHQSWMVEFFIKKGDDGRALQLARKFLSAVKVHINLFAQNKCTFLEKYRCDQKLDGSKIGEYVIQTGFGWTNGVLSSFIFLFGDKLNTFSVEDSISTETEVSLLGNSNLPVENPQQTCFSVAIK